MPPDWQDRAAALIDEFQEAFPGWGQDAYPRVEVVRECAWCDGTGTRENDEGDEVECAVCEGKKVNVSESFNFLHEYRHPVESAIVALMFPKAHVITQDEFAAALARVRHNSNIQPEPEDCPERDGAGQQINMAPGPQIGHMRTCPACEGTGIKRTEAP